MRHADDEENENPREFPPEVDMAETKPHLEGMAWIILLICGVVLVGLSFYNYALKGDDSEVTLGQIMQGFGAVLIMALILSYLLA